VWLAPPTELARERPQAQAIPVAETLRQGEASGFLRPRTFQRGFEALVWTIKSELAIQVAIGRTRPDPVPTGQLENVATLLADQVDWLFIYHAKHRAGELADQGLLRTDP
jgi:hypothetical protein